MGGGGRGAGGGFAIMHSPSVGHAEGAKTGGAIKRQLAHTEM